MFFVDFGFDSPAFGFGFRLIPAVAEFYLARRGLQLAAQERQADVFGFVLQLGGRDQRERFGRMALLVIRLLLRPLRRGSIDCGFTKLVELRVDFGDAIVQLLGDFDPGDLAERPRRPQFILRAQKLDEFIHGARRTMATQYGYEGVQRAEVG